MPREEPPKPSPIGNFFSKIGRRVRSKSPATKPSKLKLPAEGKENGTQEETQFKCPKAPNTPSRFGTLVTRFSGRKSKKDSRTFSVERSESSERSPHHVAKFSSPRPAQSENDLRFVTVRRGGPAAVDVTPLSGVTTYMSEDNLLSGGPSTQLSSQHGGEGEEGTTRSPSYINLAKSICGYRSPSVMENSPARSMGLSLVERRLRTFREPEPAVSAEIDIRTPKRAPVALPRYPETPKNVNSQIMGANYSTPTPIKNIIGQFERLNLCSAEKEDPDCKENGKTVEIVNSQPITQVHTMQIGKDADSTSMKSEKRNEEEKENKGEEGKENQEDRISLSKRQLIDDGEVRDAEKEGAEEEVNSIDTGVYSENGSCTARSGHSFQQILEDTRNALNQRVELAMKDLETVPDLPDPAADSIRMASGKAKLLIRKKISKFQELVTKNLNPIEGDLQPATVEDLEGYWALVEIELIDINNQFEEVEKWRSVDWKEEEMEKSRTDSRKILSNNNNDSVPSPKAKPRSARPGPPVNKAAAKPKTEKQKAAEESRRKQMAEARARMAAARRAEVAEEKAATEATE